MRKALRIRLVRRRLTTLPCELQGRRKVCPSPWRNYRIKHVIIINYNNY